MSLGYVGLPVLQHSQRFHFDRGRRWNAVEHLILQALVQSARSAGQLATEGNLPRRVALEALIRLMRAGWAELRAGASGVTFNATERGKAVALEDDLPAVTERMARRMVYVVDLVSGTIFRRRGLTLLRHQDWAKRTEGLSAVAIKRPDDLPRDFARTSGLLDVLFNEDEQLVRVDLSDHAPAERIALFTVRNGHVEGLPAFAPAALRTALLDAAKKAPPENAQSGTAQPIVIPRIASVQAHPERQTQIRKEDLLLNGDAHKTHISMALRKARRHVVVHSTFLDQSKFEDLLPDFRVCVARGCRVDVLWGQSDVPDGGLSKSMQAAQQIRERLQQAGLTGSIVVHMASTRSHAKVLIADDGADGMFATVGSCNWLSSGFESVEASVSLRDPRLVSDVLYQVAELARPRDGQLPELTVRLAQSARELKSRPPLTGASSVRLLVGQEHDDLILGARDRAQKQISVLSHRLGVTAKPGVLIPMLAAVRARGVKVDLFYGKPTGPVEQQIATDTSWTFREQGVDLIAVYRPRIHAKVLSWDDNDLVVTSLNWLSADPGGRNPNGELGVAITGTRIAAMFREEFDRLRTFA